MNIVDEFLKGYNSYFDESKPDRDNLVDIVNKIKSGIIQNTGEELGIFASYYERFINLGDKYNELANYCKASFSMISKNLTKDQEEALQTLSGYGLEELLNIKPIKEETKQINNFVGSIDKNKLEKLDNGNISLQDYKLSNADSTKEVTINVSKKDSLIATAPLELYNTIKTSLLKIHNKLKRNTAISNFKVENKNSFNYADNEQEEYTMKAA